MNIIVINSTETLIEKGIKNDNKKSPNSSKTYYKKICYYLISQKDIINIIFFQ